MEKFFIKHMWKIIFWLWIIIFLTWLIPLINLPTWWIVKIVFWIDQLNQIISTQYMFTTIWAIFAFWYWYKKYERDKELEIIEKYTEKYNSIKKKIYDINWIPYYCDIFNLWYEEYYLYHNWYISEKLWKEWEYWIWDDIKKFINYEKMMLNDSYIYKELINTYSRYSLHNEIWEARKIKKLDFIKIKDKNFYQFIRKFISDEFNFFNDYIQYLHSNWKNKELKKIKSEINYYNKLDDVPWYHKLWYFEK